jgi:CheY-like chemotaxis protein
MTGYGKAEDKERSQAAGFNAHLVKPVVLEDLELLLQHMPLAPW